MIWLVALYVDVPIVFVSSDADINGATKAMSKNSAVALIATLLRYAFTFSPPLDYFFIGGMASMVLPEFPVSLVSGGRLCLGTDPTSYFSTL